ncbi:MAG: sugar phosphate isomerase/epimerase [Verrucomicrobiaceae bacterium]|nr:sugar phosphate isomerase/epimerase [Verrucomicrobiaceae bacterium]
MNRRAWIKRAAVLVGASVASGAVAANGPSLRKGYMMATFPDRKLPLVEQFQMLKSAGFEGVEPPNAADADEVLSARDAAGVEVVSMSCGGSSRDFASPLAPQRTAAVAAVQKALRDAKRYGAKSILVVPGRVDEHTTYQQNWDRCSECIRACLPVAEETGVVMAIENVWNYFLQSPTEIVQFIDQFSSPLVGSHFDIGNMMCLGWPEHWIPIVGKRISAIHLKEFSRAKMNKEGKKLGFEVDYLDGDNDWPAIMNALRGIGYSGWAIAEPAYRPKDVEPKARLLEMSKRIDQLLAS